MTQFSFNSSAFSLTPSQTHARPLVDPKADPARLAAAGETVRRQLAGKPGIVAEGGDKLELFVIPHFLDEGECARLVQVVDSRIGPSALFKGTEVDGFRTSSTHYFDQGDQEVVAVQRRIADALGLPYDNAEVMQGQRYASGQQYKHHFDYFTTNQDYWRQERRRGGQRTWTAMIFLDQPEEGGATDFARIHKVIPPRTGSMVVWNNMDRAGQPNPFSLHAGTPVRAGVKHVITQWFRLDRWSLELQDL